MQSKWLIGIIMYRKLRLILQNKIQFYPFAVVLKKLSMHSPCTTYSEELCN